MTLAPLSPRELAAVAADMELLRSDPRRYHEVPSRFNNLFGRIVDVDQPIQTGLGGSYYFVVDTRGGRFRTAVTRRGVLTLTRAGGWLARFPRPVEIVPLGFCW